MSQGNANKGIFYGWIIVATLFMVNVATHTTGLLNFGLFVRPMSNDLGISRSLIGWVQTARLLSGGLSSFPIGKLLDRYGPRLLIVTAALVTGVSLAGLHYVVHIWQFFILFSLIGATGLAAPQGGALMTSVPIAKWFVRRRGRALALATLGRGVGGVIFLPITAVLIANIGWRSTWTVLAFIGVAIMVPLALLFLRRQPEDMGLNPDGDPPTPTQEPLTHTLQRAEPRWTAAEALRTSTLWKLTCAFALMGFAQGGGSIHRIPYWVDRGFDPQLVSYSFSADAAGAATMALLAGVLVDRFPVRLVATGSCVGFATAIGLMLIGSNSIFLFSSSIVFGLSVGINMIVQTFIWADYYGRAFLGTIRGIVLPVALVSSAIGAPLSGYIYDYFGNYTPAWWLLLTAYLLAALMMLSAVPPRRPLVRVPGAL